MTRRQFVAMSMAYDAIIQLHYRDANPETVRRIGEIERWLSKEWPMRREDCEGKWCSLGKNVPRPPKFDD